LAKWRAKPLAQVNYHGNPVTIAYNNIQVALKTEESLEKDACAASNGGILWPTSVAYQGEAALSS
jgi:hypothetical protein